MRIRVPLMPKNLLFVLAWAFFAASLLACLHAAGRIPEPCPSQCQASTVTDPQDLRSHNGVLKVELVHDSKQATDQLVIAIRMQTANQSPTLRVNPGDLVVLTPENVEGFPRSRSGKQST